MLVRLLSVVLMLSATFSVSWAKSVEVTGYGVIEQNNLADARKNAIEDAKRVAIEQLFGSYISARTETNNFMLAAEKIYSTTKGRLDSYTITDEQKLDDSTFVVTLLASIDELSVRSEVDQQLSKYNWLKKPRIKFSSATVDGPYQSNLQRAFDTALQNALIDKGFTILTDKFHSSINPSFILSSNLQSSVSTEQFQGMDIKSNQLLASVDLASFQTGIVISNATQSAQKAGADSLNALQKLTNQLAVRIAQRINLDTKVAWLADNQQPVLIEISANQSSSDEILAFIQEWVVGIVGVSKELQNTSTTKVLAQYQGWPEQLFDQLTVMSKQPNVPFSIEQIQGGNIVLAAK